MRNQKEMKEGGWIVDEGIIEHDNSHSADCGGHGTFWGYKKGSAAGFVKATFKGSGSVSLDFGSCFKGGTTKVYLNNGQIAIAQGIHPSVIISFRYKKGDVLKIKEEETGIMKINSFKLEDCEKEGNTVL